MTHPHPPLRAFMATAAMAATALLAALLLAPSALADADSLPMAEPESVGMSSERLQRIGKGLGRLIDAGHIPGTVSLVARRGRIVHFEAAGLRNVEAGLPMEKDTIFRLYSQTKPVTGAAVMMLFEEGHFLMTHPIAKYLPEFAEMEVYLGEQDGEIQTEPAVPITIQHLATHTAGLTYGFFPTPVGKMYADVLDAPKETSGPDSLEAWAAALAELPLVAQPGAEWHYSVGMDVLGRLVEVVSGMSLRGVPAAAHLRSPRHGGYRLPRAGRQARPLRRQLHTHAGRRDAACGRSRNQLLPATAGGRDGGAGAWSARSATI